MSGFDDARGTGGSRKRFVAAMLLSAAALVVQPAPVSAQTYSFSRVTVEGNELIEPRVIVSRAGIAGGQVSAADLNDAYQRLVNSGLFESVNLVPRGGTLVIQVKENPTINVINFEGNRRLRTEILSAAIESRSRRVYSAAQAESDAALIAEIYAKQGRLAARVEPRIIRRPGNRVDLVFEIAEGGVVEVESLTFVGNRAFSDRRLRQVLQTKQAGLLRSLISRDTYAAERVEVDKQLLRDFYQSRGYIDFQVVDATAELARERDGFFVTFTVREGLQYRYGQTSVRSEIPEIDTAPFEAFLNLRRGTTYSPSEMELVIARMETLAARQGLNFVRVDPRVTRNDADQTLDIDFVLVRGQRIFVERIDIEGNATTVDQVIRRQFRTVEGDPLNPREIREAAERIRALGFFGDAAVEATEGSGPEQVVVKAVVTEQPTGSLNFGASYGKADGVGLTIGLSESNFLGRGQFVSLDLNLGAKNATSSFTFAEPALLGRDLRFSFTGLYAQTEANFATWDTRIVQTGVSLEFPLSANARFQTRYTLSKSRMFNVAAAGSPILQAEEARGGLYGSALGYEYSWDNRRGGLAGDTAYVLRFGQDFYGIGGDLRYLKTELFAGAETKVLNGEVRLRAELEAGVLSGVKGGSRVTERFFLDGKMRGFRPFGVGPRDLGSNDALGGNKFAVARLEADFPIGLPEEYKVRGAVFMDVGSVWGLDNTAGAGVVDPKMRLRSSIGAAILWDTPIGPLRFNFTRAIRKETYDREQRFDLTISTKF